VARRRFLLLLYARLVCFRVFLQCAKATEGGITEDHKVRWLLIQVAPETLLRKTDIFLACTRLAGMASTDYFGCAIQKESNLIEQLIPQQPTLFCVLDKAQALIEDKGYFQYDTRSEEGGPVLRPILRSWGSILPNLIVSGTRLPMQEVDSVVGSMVAKEGDSGRVKAETDVGGFDNEVSQRAYLDQYFPVAIWTNPREKRSHLGLDIGCVAGSFLMLLSDKRLLIECIDIVLLQLTSHALSKRASDPPIEC
jgi:hypothetical protein